jgi:hypothetical protein
VIPGLARERPVSLRDMAIAYAAAIAVVALWAGWVDVLLPQASQRFPDVLLGLLAFPMSLSLPWVGVPGDPLAQSAWLVACGAVQAAALFLVARRL